MDRKQRRFLTTWIAFTFIFFTLSPGKRDQYILPAIPAFALFGGWFFNLVSQCSKDTFKKSISIPAYILSGLAGLFVLEGIAYLIIKTFWGEQLQNFIISKIEKGEYIDVNFAAIPIGLFIIIMTAAFTILLISTKRRNLTGIFIGTLLILGGGNYCINTQIYPAINNLKSGRVLTEKIAQYRDNNEPVGIYGFFPCGIYPACGLFPASNAKNPQRRRC